ncbi:MAG TPA: c-type cytochrome biogenesis protein CcmI [Beijerinckiaceae bacterium]|jgi:cytochrome c-type biogenesis protein CcmH
MAIWVVFALMTGAAVLAVLWPLSRPPARPAEERVETKFYRDQIAEIDRDVERGLLSAVEAEAARTEAGRRLLRATVARSAAGDAMGEPALRRRRAVSAIALSVVPLIALAIYGAYGSPQLPSQPLSARLQAQPERIDVAAAVARIEAHLAARPDDGRGWEVVAPVYARTGRFDDAARAYAAAIRLLGETAPRLTSYGEALVGAKDGVVPADARAAFEKALTHDPADPKALFYLAEAAGQDGDPVKALGYYADLMARSPADAPWLPLVRERMAKLPGGTTAQAAAAETVAALPAPDREVAIRGMVEGLAARLESAGGSPDEWTRLVRSYAVLGERDKARSALDKARQAVAENAPRREGLDALARELGLDGLEAKR